MLTEEYNLSLQRQSRLSQMVQILLKPLLKTFPEAIQETTRLAQQITEITH